MRVKERLSGHTRLKTKETRQLNVNYGPGLNSLSKKDIIKTT